jgi:hypothetical protein
LGGVGGFNRIDKGVVRVGTGVEVAAAGGKQPSEREREREVEEDDADADAPITASAGSTDGTRVQQLVPLDYEEAPAYPPHPVPSPSSSASHLESNPSTIPQDDDDPRLHGSLRSPRGVLIVLTISASQLLDNISLTSVTMALTAISREFGIREADQQWLISAYT